MRYFIYLKYDGSNYHGWQTQPNASSVQETIEKKLSMLTRRELTIVGAGRTDAGVHASCMVAHTEIEELNMPLEQLTFKLNQVLPPDIVILKIIRVQPDAHARFSATSRTYRYYITTGKPLYNRQYTMRVFERLDIELMNHACAKLFCYEDFTSFSKLHTDTKTNICHIQEAYWTQVPAGPADAPDTENYVFTITADRFLRNMVRAIVGTLLKVGRHQLTVQGFAKIIEGKDRCIAGDSVLAQGLFLENIEYPESCFLPDNNFDF